MAGGNHCPNLSIISNNKNSILIDVENLIYEKAQLIGLNKSNLIEQINDSTYLDGSNNSHSTFNFILNSVNEYTCDFITGEDGVMDLVVKFK